MPLSNKPNFEMQKKLLTKDFGDLTMLAYSVEFAGREVVIKGTVAPLTVPDRAVERMFDDLTTRSPLITVSGGRAAEPRQFRWTGKSFQPV